MNGLNFKYYTVEPKHIDGDISEENYWFVVAECQREGMDLIVAEFPYDGGGIYSEYYKEQARLMAIEFARRMNMKLPD